MIETALVLIVIAAVVLSTAMAVKEFDNRTRMLLGFIASGLAFCGSLLAYLS